jgi:hypothetical protein
MNISSIKYFLFFLFVANISSAQSNLYKMKTISIKENGKIRAVITNNIQTKNNTTGKSHINYFKMQLSNNKSIKIGFADYNGNAQHFDPFADGITVIKAHSKYFDTYKNSISSCSFKDTVILKIDGEYYEFNFKEIKNNKVYFKNLSYIPKKHDLYLGEFVDTSTRFKIELDEGYYYKSLSQIIQENPQYNFFYIYIWSAKMGADAILNLQRFDKKKTLVISCFDDMHGNVSLKNIVKIGMPGIITRQSSIVNVHREFSIHGWPSGTLCTKTGKIIGKGISVNEALKILEEL